jgi:hypothetical protein
MLTVPIVLQRRIVRCAPLFSERVWGHAQVLVVGALLAPGNRTVTAALRGMGLSQEEQYQHDHRVLKRARWASLAVARVLRGVLVNPFGPAGPGVSGRDDTLARRRGEKLRAKGL